MPGPTRSEVINEFGEELGKFLITNGFSSISALMGVSDERLLALPNMGAAELARIRAIAPFRAEVISPEYFQVELSPGRMLELPKLQMPSGVTIAFFNLLGDPYLAKECAQLLWQKFGSDLNGTIIVTPEVKAIPLAHELAGLMDTDYVILRKHFKPYFGLKTLTTTVRAITSAEPWNNLYLTSWDRDLLDSFGHVLLLDDVVSTGSTLHAMRRLMELAGITVQAEAAVFKEGDAPIPGLKFLAQLPVWK